MRFRERSSKPSHDSFISEAELVVRNIANGIYRHSDPIEDASTSPFSRPVSNLSSGYPFELHDLPPSYSEVIIIDESPPPYNQNIIHSWLGVAHFIVSQLNIIQIYSATKQTNKQTFIVDSSPSYEITIIMIRYFYKWTTQSAFSFTGFISIVIAITCMIQFTINVVKCLFWEHRVVWNG